MPAMLLPTDPREANEAESSEDDGVRGRSFGLRRRWSRYAPTLGTVAATVVGCAGVIALLDVSQEPARADAGVQEGLVELAGEAEKPADPAESDAPPRLCTDGWAFSFRVAVEFKGTGHFDIINSSSGALQLFADATDVGQATLSCTVKAFGQSTTTVKTSVDRYKPHLVTVDKSTDGLCLSLAPYDAPNNKSKPTCMWVNTGVQPISGFQMLPVGKLSIGDHSRVRVSNFAQHQGFVTIRFELTGVDFATIWKTKAEEEKLRKATSEAIAFSAENGIMPAQALVFAAAGDARRVLIMATVTPTFALESDMSDLACMVEDTLVRNVKSGTFAAAIANRAKNLQVATVGTVGIQKTSVPAEPMANKDVRCKETGHRAASEKLQCSGYGCLSSACEDPAAAGDVPPLQPYQEGMPTAATELEMAKPNGGFEWKMPEPAPQNQQVATTEAEKPKAPTLGQSIAKFWHGVLTKNSYTKTDARYTLHTDGYELDLEVKAQIAAGAFQSEQVILASEPGDGITLKAVPGAQPGVGVVRLEVALLSGSGNGGCTVDSAQISEGKPYTITLIRDTSQCCVNVQQSDIASEGDLKCSQRDAAAVDFQMRPGGQVVVPKGLRDVTIDSFKERKASLTTSFTIVDVNYDYVIGECKCMAEFERAIQESIAYQAGKGTRAQNVAVSLQRSAYFGQMTLPRLSDEQVFALHDQFARPVTLSSPEVSEWDKLQETLREAKLKVVENRTMAEELAAEEPKTDMVDPKGDETFAKNLEKVSGKLGKTVRRLEEKQSYVDALRAAMKKVDPGFSARGSDAVAVQVTISRCDDKCDQIKDALSATDLVDVVKDRVSSVIGDGHNGKKTRRLEASTFRVVSVAAPAETATCAQVMCTANTFTINENPTLPCFGAGCETECCKPRTCSQVTCSGGMEPIGASVANKTCSNNTACADTCCVTRCSKFACVGESLCSRSLAWTRVAMPSQAKDICCRKHQCCTGPTAACASCMTCQNLKAFCTNFVNPFLKVAYGPFSRRLRGGDMDDMEDDFEPPEYLNGGIPPEVAPVGPTAAELAEDLVEAAQILAETEAHLKKEAMARRLDDQGLTQVWSGDVAHPKLDLLKAAHDMSKGTIQVQVAPPVESPTGTDPMAWNKAIGHAFKANNGILPGCEALAAVPRCPYTFRTIFAAHRLSGPTPKAVNTVQVLSDTVHAVSCGDDGLCWIWKIRSGAPTQVWIADNLGDLKPRPPIVSASVLNDATYILSAGPKDPASNYSKGGVAYIWDWRLGFQIKTISCSTGAYLSSAEMQAWRMVLLGCTDGFTTIWEWMSGSMMRVPYHARTAQEISQKIMGMLKQFFDNDLDGWQRLVIMQQLKNAPDFIKYINETYPDIATEIGLSVDLFDYLHTNNMGWVTGIAYQPTNLRFTTTSSDGMVRFWDATTGTLLMVMQGHSGKVNCVAPFPDKMQAATGGDDGTVRVWDLPNGFQKRLFYLPSAGAVLSVAIVPGGRDVVAGYDDGYVRIWNSDNGLLLCQINTGGGAVRGLAINPSNPLGQLLVANEDGLVRVFDPSGSVVE